MQPIISEKEDLLKNDYHLLSFETAVKKLAANDDTGIYPNSGPEHAAIVLGNIFKRTNESIYAFVEDLNGKVTDHNYCSEHFDMMLANSNIDINYILMQLPPREHRKVLNKLLKRRNDHPDKTKVYILDSNKNINEFFGDIKPYNFTVSDRKAFRMENDICNFIADFSFNNTELSERILHNSFEPIKELYSKALELTEDIN